jgi:hypothetical protein
MKFHYQGEMGQIKESIWQPYLIQEGCTSALENEKSSWKEIHAHDKTVFSTLLKIIQSAIDRCSYCTQGETLLFVSTVLMNTGRFLLIKVQGK